MHYLESWTARPNNYESSGEGFTARSLITSGFKNLMFDLAEPECEFRIESQLKTLIGQDLIMNIVKIQIRLAKLNFYLIA
jgi:hypothetical protein